MKVLKMSWSEILEKKGFFIINNFLSSDLVSSDLNNIKSNISLSSLDLDISVAKYLSSTGRWGDKSKITRDISDSLDSIIKDKLLYTLKCPVTLKKSNVICKTADLIDAVPFHQDISYSSDQPYHFSVWLALNNVEQNSGALQIIKYSHTLQIKSAVDFWSPYFVDSYSEKLKNEKMIELRVLAGDAIVFDSRLWHGSAENLAAKDRFAYVTRWIIDNKNFPFIPKPEPLVFGMFNCRTLTEQILQKSLLCLNPQDQNFHIPQTLENLITIWLAYLRNGLVISGVDSFQAIRDLSRLLILHRAAALHDAGDIAGKIYKNLWFSLLKLLK